MYSERSSRHLGPVASHGREWTSERDYATRVANIHSTDNDYFEGRLNDGFFLTAAGTDRTVFDDEDRDILVGGCGLDWFLANLEPDDADGPLDCLADLGHAEVADDLEWILSE
jgi:hypothetical protein